VATTAVEIAIHVIRRRPRCRAAMCSLLVGDGQKYNAVGSEARNPKPEIRREIPSSKPQSLAARGRPWSFGHWGFDSDFRLRISDLPIPLSYADSLA
jgi:hypothetical protein